MKKILTVFTLCLISIAFPVSTFAQLENALPFMNPKVEQYYIKHQITDYTYIPYTFITETYHLANIIVSRFQVQDQLVQFQLEIDKAKNNH